MLQWRLALAPAEAHFEAFVIYCIGRVRIDFVIEEVVIMWAVQAI